MQPTRDVQTGTSKTRVVEQIKAALRSGEYARALDLLRSAGAESAGDSELAELQKLAQDGATRKSEADRLITESQELFAQQKSVEAIQRLRTAYELDKTNSLARTILANALVEHAQSIVDDDWLEAEKLSNQALALNPAHPTAKNILNIIVQKKETSPVDDWALQANKLHSSGDLFAALAWVAEGLAVHPHDPKLLQIQDAVQRDQEVRRRQARRGDLDELRRLQQEIAGAADGAAKQALVVRIQTVAAKHWTDGEILSIANALLLRLGLVPQESATASQRRKGGTVIFHVPRANAPMPASADAPQAPATTVASTPAPTVPTATHQVATNQVATNQPATTPIPSGTSAQGAAAAPAKIQPNSRKTEKVASTPEKKEPAREKAAKVDAPAPAAAPVKATPPAAESRPVAKVAAPTFRTGDPKSKSTLVIVLSAVAVTALGAVLFFAYARKNQATPEVANAPATAPTVPASTPAEPAAVPETTAPAISVAVDSTTDASQPVASVSPRTTERPVAEDQRAVGSSFNTGTLVVWAGQDDARVLLNGKLQRQLTRGGQLRIPNLEAQDYVVQVSKSGFQDPAQQRTRIRKGEEAKLTFNLQPVARMASLSIQGAAPGTAVFVDQNAVGTVQADGALTVSSVNPGDHVVELRKERFKARQLQKHFVAGAPVSITGADTRLEAAAGELKITFTPADAKVALVKGDFLKIVTSGVPLSLDAGTYTLTARTAERITRTGTVEIVSGQSKTLDLPLAANGMSKWEDAGAWKHEGDSFTRKGGEFVLYGVVPAAGTFTFSGMAVKGHLLQWVVNYSDSRNYILFQLDENGLHRTAIRNGERRDEIIVPHKGDKKSFRTVQIRISATEIVHQIKEGDNWTVLDRYTLPGVNLSAGKFGFYIPGNDQVSVSSFAQYADLNFR